MSNYLSFLISMLAIVTLSGCTTYRAERPSIIQVEMPEKAYKIGDELYLGGGSFTYPKGILTGENIKLNWIDCGLNKGWLGG